jgi:hypothetical protein
MRKLGALISTAVAIIIGFLILLSFIFPSLEAIRDRILGWAILLAAVALLIGLVNLFRVHFDNVRQNQRAFYSFILLLGMMISFVATLIQGRHGNLSNWLFNNIQVPVETSLMAILAVTLTLGAARLIQRRSEISTIVFVVVLFIILLGSGPLFGLELPIFTRSITPYLTRVLSIGATRGLLIGIALGTLATAIRILIGADRPYEG